MSVVTGTSPPRSASPRVIGRSRSRSAPFRVKTGCGRTRIVTTRSPPSGPWPVSLTFVPVVGAAGDRDVEPPAVDLDPPGRAVVGLLEADLGDRLGGRPAGRRGRRPAAPRADRRSTRRSRRPRSGPSRRGCRRTTARRPRAAPRPRGPAASADRLRVAAEEHPEEVGEVAAAHRRRPELVADVAGRGRIALPPAPDAARTGRRRRTGCRRRPGRRRPASTPPSPCRGGRTSCACRGRTGPRWPR